jgi:hypothetical protein
MKIKSSLFLSNKNDEKELLELFKFRSSVFNIFLRVSAASKIYSLQKVLHSNREQENFSNYSVVMYWVSPTINCAKCILMLSLECDWIFMIISKLLWNIMAQLFH